MDNKKNAGSPDRELINVNEAYEVAYWSTKFNISPDKLRQAVKDVGTSAKTVEKHLKGK